MIIWGARMSKIKLDKDEKEILESFERGEWKSVQMPQRGVLTKESEKGKRNLV